MTKMPIDSDMRDYQSVSYGRSRSRGRISVAFRVSASERGTTERSERYGDFKPESWISTAAIPSESCFSGCRSINAAALSPAGQMDYIYVAESRMGPIDDEAQHC